MVRSFESSKRLGKELKRCLVSPGRLFQSNPSISSIMQHTSIAMSIRLILWTSPIAFMIAVDPSGWNLKPIVALSLKAVGAALNQMDLKRL